MEEGVRAPRGAEYVFEIVPGDSGPCGVQLVVVRLIEINRNGASPPIAAYRTLLITINCRYAKAIDLSPDTPVLRALHSNRALAFTKLGRFQEALLEADAAVGVAPLWDKAHWRRGCALEGLRRVPESVGAFLRVWQLTKGRWLAVCVLITNGKSTIVLASCKVTF